MIKLYQFAPAVGLPNPSPFCMKLENYLRMAGLPFETPCADLGTFRRAPKGKLPYIEDNGKLLADSAFILDYLKATYGDKLDAGLTVCHSTPRPTPSSPICFGYRSNRS